MSGKAFEFNRLASYCRKNPSIMLPKNVVCATYGGDFQERCQLEGEGLAAGRAPASHGNCLAAPAAPAPPIPIASQTATLPAALPRPTTAALALSLALPLAHKTVGPNVAKGSFHGIRLGLSSLPVSAVTAIVFHVTVRSAPVSPAPLPCPIWGPLSGRGALTVALGRVRSIALATSYTNHATRTARPAHARTTVAVAAVACVRCAVASGCSSA